RRLAHRAGGTVGVNIGKTKRVPEAEALADFAASAERLAPLADYLVVNVSSPNTPGLRDLQAAAKLRPLLAAVRAACDLASPMRRVPLLVKIAPDLADEDIDAIAELAVELGLDGIIATNTTISRAGLATPADAVAELGAGGLSGAPLQERSLAVLRRLRARAGARLTLIAAGGIETADDAWQRIRAGATLVQGYTGFIYGGPGWPRHLQRQLAAKVRAAGLSSIEEAIGADADAITDAAR
ncbi:MAG TPA: dihydroorotate dehydrogenase (quinone), partial [Kofleriaceae bacterium]|nr:dihydroorotate dehydrogenase (quinone) [Kofleriaceae bacterium]